MRLSEKIAIAGLTSVLVKFLTAGVNFHWGEAFSFSFGSVDAATCAAILATCLGSPHLETYVGGKKDENRQNIQAR